MFTWTVSNFIDYITIPPLNSLVRAENRERINAFSATDEADLKVNCYIFTKKYFRFPPTFLQYRGLYVCRPTVRKQNRRT